MNATRLWNETRDDDTPHSSQDGRQALTDLSQPALAGRAASEQRHTGLPLTRLVGLSGGGVQQQWEKGSSAGEESRGFL